MAHPYRHLEPEPARPPRPAWARLKTRARRRFALLLAWKLRRDRRIIRRLAHQPPRWKGRSPWLGGVSLADIQRAVDTMQRQVDINGEWFDARARSLGRSIEIPETTFRLTPEQWDRAQLELAKRRSVARSIIIDHED